MQFAAVKPLLNRAPASGSGRIPGGESRGRRIPGESPGESRESRESRGRESRGQTGRSPICDYVSNALRNKRETGLVRIGDRCFGSPAFSCGQDALHPFL